jgi:hypothetical protein
LRNAKAFAAIQTISSNFFIRSRFAQLHPDSLSTNLLSLTVVSASESKPRIISEEKGNQTHSLFR